MDVQSGKEIDSLVKLLVRAAFKVAVGCHPHHPKRYCCHIRRSCCCCFGSRCCHFCFDWSLGFGGNPASFRKTLCLPLLIALFLLWSWWFLNKYFHIWMPGKGEGATPLKEHRKNTIGCRWAPNAPSQFLYYFYRCLFCSIHPEKSATLTKHWF